MRMEQNFCAVLQEEDGEKWRQLFANIDILCVGAYSPGAVVSATQIVGICDLHLQNLCVALTYYDTFSRNEDESMPTAKEFFEEVLPGRLESNPDKAKSIGAIYQFNIDGDDGGIWLVNLTKEADWITAGASDDSECTITCASSDFVDMIEGRLPGPQAFMMGKLKIEGNMGLAMKLSNILS